MTASLARAPILGRTPRALLRSSTIWSSLGISSTKIAGHSPDFVRAACSQKGLDAIGLGAAVLADTALDLLEDEALLQKVKEDHAWHVAHQKELPL